MRTTCWAALAAALLTTSAQAQTAAPGVSIAQMTMGYTYFNRPGADMKAHDADLTDCMGSVSTVVSLDEMIGNNEGIVGALISGSSHKGVVAASLENCMVVHGWRVVRLPEAEGAALAALPLGELSQRLKPWIGAEAPTGQVVRVWNNDAARASTDRYAIRPARDDDQQLSLKISTATPPKPASAQSPPPGLATPAVKLDPKWPKRTLKPAQIAGAPEEAAVIVVLVKGVSMRNGTGLVFARMGPDPDVPLSLTDHGPDLINPAIGVLFAKKEGNWFAFAVPAGRWRLAAIGGMPTLDLCLGGPSFEAKAGEVLYAGSFDLGSEDLGPDLALAPAQAFLAGQPAANAVRPAVYTNGARGRCGTTLYALEIKGAPFEPGYTLGGAHPAAARAD